MAWGARLAEIGGEVIITTPVSRHREARNGRAVMTDQEFLYRSAFELGRHVLGYQVHEALAAIDALSSSSGPTTSSTSSTSTSKALPVIVIGWGEGGWVALHAAAVSSSVDAVCVSGHFQSRQQVWQEPIHRNVQGLLSKFGDAELAAMIAPRHAVIDAIPGPQVEIGGDGGAPGKLSGPTVAAARDEYARTEKILKPAGLNEHIQLVVPAQPPAMAGASMPAIEATLKSIGITPQWKPNDPASRDAITTQTASHVSASARRLAMLDKWNRFSQHVLEHAVDERAAYWKALKTDNLSNFKATVEPYREKFASEVIGRWEMPLLPAQPRSRLFTKSQSGLAMKSSWMSFPM